VERPGVEPGSQCAFPVKQPPLALPIIPAAASRAVALARCVLRVVNYIFMPVLHSLACSSEVPQGRDKRERERYQKRLS